MHVAASRDRDMGETSREDFLGCPMDRLTLDGTVETCLEWVRAKDRPHQVIVINAGLIVMMRTDPDLRRAVREADLVLPDGVPVVWASKLLGRGLPGRVNGTDLMDRLILEAHRKRLRVFFLGAREHVVERVVEVVGERYPGLVVAGHHHGYFKGGKEREVIREVRESGADILFVGISSPFKEVWCHDHLEELGVPVVHGVGGSLDVLAGYVPRAPLWMQNWGLEWLWRLMMEPGRMWKRYLVTNTIFIRMVFAAYLKRALGGTAGR